MNYSKSCFIARTTRQGLPTATECLGIFLVTVLPAPMIEPSPIVTPGITETLAPIHTFFSIVIGSAFSIP